MAPLKRDSVTEKRDSVTVTPPACADGMRDTRDNNPIGVVTLSRPSRLGAGGAFVEPLPSGRQWVRGDHSVRLTVQVRPHDIATMERLMAGTGARQSQFARRMLQRGLEAEHIDQAATKGEGK